MELVYERANNRTKRAVARFQLSSLGWDAVELDAFAACKTALAEQVKVSHRDEKQRLSVYTDASNFFGLELLRKFLCVTLLLHIRTRTIARLPFYPVVSIPHSMAGLF